MCEPRLLRAARKGSGYDFSPIFDGCDQLFQRADLLIGNLETPLAGSEAGYTKSLFSFNAPVEFAIALKNAGFGLVLTANNHCLDRGTQGMRNTVRALDEIGLRHTGVIAEESRSPLIDLDLGETRVSVLSCTYGTNYASNKVLLKEADRCSVNLLQSQKGHVIPGDAGIGGQSLAKRILCRLTTQEQRIWVKRKLGMPYYRAYSDDVFDPVEVQDHLQSFSEGIEKARAEGRSVIVCPHVGGQFNGDPGALTRYVFDWFASAGANAIVASHPHVVQSACVQNTVPMFYSLGNGCMSPTSVYLLPDNKPAYGIAAHLIFDRGKMVESRFSILKSVEDASGMLRVFPVNKLYASLSRSDERDALLDDVRFILTRVTGQLPEGDLLREEYSLGQLAAKL